jgi:hypothetical protein
MEALKEADALPGWRLSVHSRDMQEKGEVNIPYLQKMVYNILGRPCDCSGGSWVQ